MPSDQPLRILNLLCFLVAVFILWRYTPKGWTRRAFVVLFAPDGGLSLAFVAMQYETKQQAIGELAELSRVRDERPECFRGAACQLSVPHHPRLVLNVADEASKDDLLRALAKLRPCGAVGGERRFGEEVLDYWIVTSDHAFVIPNDRSSVR